MEDKIEDVLTKLYANVKPTGEEIFYYITDDGRYLWSDNPDHHEELAEIFKDI